MNIRLAKRRFVERSIPLGFFSAVLCGSAPSALKKLLLCRLRFFLLRGAEVDVQVAQLPGLGGAGGVAH